MGHVIVVLTVSIHDEVGPVNYQQIGHLRVLGHLVDRWHFRDEGLPLLQGVAVLVNLLDLVQEGVEEVRLLGLARVELLPEVEVELLHASRHRPTYLYRDRRRALRQRIPEVVLLRRRVLPVRDAAVDPVPGKILVDLRVGASLDGLPGVYRVRLRHPRLVLERVEAKGLEGR